MTLQHLVLLVEIENRESRQQDVTKKTAKVTSCKNKFKRLLFFTIFMFKDTFCFIF